MSDHVPPPDLLETFNRAVFAALVRLQDTGQSVWASRAGVAREFGLTDRQVQDVEREGLDNQWPRSARPSEHLWSVDPARGSFRAAMLIRQGLPGGGASRVARSRTARSAGRGIPPHAPSRSPDTLDPGNRLP